MSFLKLCQIFGQIKKLWKLFLEWTFDGSIFIATCFVQTQCKNSWISHQDLGFSYKILLPLEFLDKILESLTSSKTSLISWQEPCQDSYQEIREVKISISSKFSTISQVVELGLFTVILGHVMEKLWKNQ